MQSMPSAAAQVIVTVIPIVGIVMGSIVVFFYLLYSHRQKMLMIEKGILKRNPVDMEQFSLFSGLFLFGIGISLTLFFLIKEGFSYSVLSGLVPLSGGISLLLFFIIRVKLRNERNE